MKRLTQSISMLAATCATLALAGCGDGQWTGWRLFENGESAPAAPPPR